MRHCSKTKVVSTEVVRSVRGQTEQPQCLRPLSSSSAAFHLIYPGRNGRGPSACRSRIGDRPSVRLCCEACRKLPPRKCQSGMDGRSAVGHCRRVEACPAGTEYRRKRRYRIEHTWLGNRFLL